MRRRKRWQRDWRVCLHDAQDVAIARRRGKALVRCMACGRKLRRRSLSA